MPSVAEVISLSMFGLGIFELMLLFALVAGAVYWSTGAEMLWKRVWTRLSVQPMTKILPIPTRPRTCLCKLFDRVQVADLVRP